MMQQQQQPPPPNEQQPIDNNSDDEFDFVKFDNEEVEIAQLQLPEEEPQIPAEEEPLKEKDERIPDIEFKCSSCCMQLMIHYFGTQPPFALGVAFSEDTFVLRDPFMAPPPRFQTKPENFIAIGAKCHACSQMICKDNACSFPYINTYCLRCAPSEAKHWPLEVRSRLQKQVGTIKI